VDKTSVEDLNNILSHYKERYRGVRKEIKEIEEKEKNLKKELETVRNHLNYYESLVSDMKKMMEGRKNIDFLDQL